MIPAITALPAAPTPDDFEEVFEAKSFDFVAAQERLVIELNAFGKAADQLALEVAEDALSAQRDSDLALGFRNEANAAKSAALSHAGLAAQSKADADVARGSAVKAAGDAGSAAGRAETAAASAERVVVNAVQQTSPAGVALLPQGGNGGLPPVGGIPAGYFLLRGSTEDPTDYRPEFFNRFAAAWQTLSSREWIIGYVSQLFQRIAALEAAPKPIAPGGAPQFVARAWVNFNGTTIRASGNISSVGKSSTGIFVANLITAVPDVNCAAVCTGSNSSVARLSISAEMINTTQCRMAFHQVGTGDVDPTNASLIIVR